MAKRTALFMFGTFALFVGVTCGEGVWRHFFGYRIDPPEPRINRVFDSPAMWITYLLINLVLTPIALVLIGHSLRKHV